MKFEARKPKSRIADLGSWIPGPISGFGLFRFPSLRPFDSVTLSTFQLSLSTIPLNFRWNQLWISKSQDLSFIESEAVLIRRFYWVLVASEQIAWLSFVVVAKLFRPLLECPVKPRSNRSSNHSGNNSNNNSSSSTMRVMKKQLTGRTLWELSFTMKIL